MPHSASIVVGLGRYEDLAALAWVRPLTGSGPGRCWFAVPMAEAPHVLCTGCRERFETLTGFEAHIRRQELHEASLAEKAGMDRRRRSERVGA